MAQQLPQVESAVLVNFLSARRFDIIDKYERVLHDTHNPIADEQAALLQARRVAEDIISDVINSLRVGKVQVDDRYRLLASEVGVARAARRVHPNHSILAASAFFREVLSAVAGALGVHPKENSMGLVTLVAHTLEESISLRTRQSLESYTGYLLNDVHEAHNEEHRRIARELHDRVGPGMTVTHRQLELYQVYENVDPERASGKVKNARHAIRESMNELRSITSGMHSRLHVKSLEQALLNFLDTIDFEATTVRLRVNGNESWAAPDVLDEVFLIIREAVRNVFQHAAASMLLINVNITPHELNALIEDDGQGFGRDRPASADGVGLRSMRERARGLNGRVSVNSSLAGGTQVDLSLPLSGASG